MAWKAVHPDNTLKLRVPDEDGAPIFEIGFWPPSIAEKLAEVEDPTTSKDDRVRHGKEMVEFGVRGWTGFEGIECATETVELDGLKFKKLTAESMRALYANKLVAPLLRACWHFNVLAEEQKKTFDWRLPLVGSKTRTDARRATPDTKAASERSSGSKGKSSTGAPTS